MYMAERENIRDRIRRINPRALEINDKLDEILRRIGYTGAIVDTTEDMTDDEKELVLFEGFLKEGYPREIAEQKAAEWVKLEKLFFD